MYTYLYFLIALIAAYGYNFVLSKIFLEMTPVWYLDSFILALHIFGLLLAYTRERERRVRSYLLLGFSLSTATYAVVVFLNYTLKTIPGTRPYFIYTSLIFILAFALIGVGYHRAIFRWSKKRNL